MALPTVSGIKATHVEFAKISDTLLQSFIDEAVSRLDAEVWAQHYHTGLLYLTLHLAAMSPYGQNARLVNKDGTTTYGVTYDGLVKIVGSGFRTAGNYTRGGGFYPY